MLLQDLETMIMDYVKDELKKMKNVLSPDNQELENLKDEEEHQKGSRKALLKITLNFMRQMKQDDLADSLQKSKYFSKNMGVRW